MHLRTRAISTLSSLCLLLIVPRHGAGGQGRPPSALNPSLLRPSTDTIAVTVEAQGRVMPVAFAIESLRRVRRGGMETLEQSYRWMGNDGSHTADTLWLRAADLRPIENHRHNGVHDAMTTFRASGAHTRFAPVGGSEQVSDTTVRGPLFASGELATLIRAAPLAVGYAARYLLYYGPPRASVRTGPVHVTGSAFVRTRDGRAVDCWIVDAELSEGLSTFYVGKADRRVVKLVNHEDPRAAFVFSR